MTSVGEDVKNGNTCARLMGLYSTSAATENGMAILKKIKNRICDLAVPLWVSTPVKIRTLRLLYTHAALFTRVKRKKQPKCLLEMKEKAKCSIYI